MPKTDGILWEKQELGAVMGLIMGNKGIDGINEFDTLDNG